MTDVVLEQTEAVVEITRPIIVDLGKQGSKRIKALKAGNGKLWDEVVDVLQEVKGSLGQEADGKVLVPVILVYRKQSRRFRGGFGMMP